MTQSIEPKGPITIPILAVTAPDTCPLQSCGLSGITVQIPFELFDSVLNGFQTSNRAQFIFSDGKNQTEQIEASANTDQVHVLRAGDALSPLKEAADFAMPLVTHADGRLVTSGNPALAGEEITIYAVGLGRPLAGPAPVTGDLTRSLFRAPLSAVSYDYRLNASPSKAGIPSDPSSIDPYLRFVRMSPGSVGLYQVNLAVPPPPPGLLACGDLVSSNLTVTLIALVSFDGAGICVKSAAVN